MPEQDLYRNSPSILATLQCLPDVVETNSESAWQMFLALQAADSSPFTPTQPSGAQLLSAAIDARPRWLLTVQDVMVEARRFNRVSPCEPEWQDLYALLKAADRGEPRQAGDVHDEADEVEKERHARILARRLGAGIVLCVSGGSLVPCSPPH